MHGLHWTAALIGRLLRKLKGGRPDFAAAHASAPAGTRLYAIGDIHGRDDLLAGLLASIEQDARDAPELQKILIYLGDYVDRGLQSKEVIDRIVAGPPAGFEAVCLKGNHEDALLHFLRDPTFGKTWKYYGGLETLHSYGISELTLRDDPAAFEEARRHFERVLPPGHRAFLDQLQPSAVFGDYFFAHAGVRPGIPLERQAEEDLLWIREDFLHADEWFGKVVVHGHTPSEDPVFRPNRIGVDTGAYMTNRLTCLVLEGSERRVIQSGPDMRR